MLKRFGFWMIIFFCYCGNFAHAGKGDQLPAYRLRSLPYISKKITENCSNDSLKTIAILQWMSEHLRYDWFRYDRSLRIPVSPKRINFRRKAGVGGYANVFREMCKHAGIETELVSGYAYTNDLVHGQPLYSGNQLWVMVRFNQRWHPISPYEVCTNYITRPRLSRRIWTWFGIPVIHDRHKHLQNFDTSKIYKAPQEFRENHLPLIDDAQVLQNKESLSFFERHDSIYNDTSLAAAKYHDESFTMFNSDPLWLQNYTASKIILKVNPRNYLDAGIEHVNYTIHAKQAFLEGSEDLYQQRDTLKFLIRQHGESQKLLRKAHQMNTDEAAYYSKANKFRKQLLFGNNLKNQNFLQTRFNELKKLKTETKRLKADNNKKKNNIEKTIHFIRKSKYKTNAKKMEGPKSALQKKLKKAISTEAEIARLMQQSDSIVQSIDSANSIAQSLLLIELEKRYDKIDTLRIENIHEEKLNVPLAYEWDIFCRSDTIRLMEKERKTIIDSLENLRKKSILKKQNELRKIARDIQKKTEKQIVILASLPTDLSDSAFYNEELHNRIIERSVHAYQNYHSALQFQENLFDGEMANVSLEMLLIIEELKKMKKENHLIKQTYKHRKKQISRSKKQTHKTIRAWQKISDVSKKKKSAQLRKLNQEIRTMEKEKKSGTDS
jgi:hypothetical protein